MRLGSRLRNNTCLAAISNLSRAFTTNFNRRDDATVTATDISFTNPATIASVANAFGVFTAGQLIRVKGSASNNRDFTIVTAAEGSLTVTPGVVTTESAGATVTVRQI